MSSIGGLKFTMSLDKGNESNKGFTGYLSSFAFNVKKTLLFSLSFVLASTTGIAFGVGGPFDAFQASMAGKVLSPLQDNLRKYILLPSLVAGFITWCATYIRPMIETVKSYFQYNIDPEMYTLYKELNALDKDLSWYQPTSKDKRSTIKYYLTERAKILNNFSYNSLDRCIKSAETLYNSYNCPNVKDIRPEQYILAQSYESSAILTQDVITHISDRNDNDTINLASISCNPQDSLGALMDVKGLDIVYETIHSNNDMLLNTLNTETRKCEYTSHFTLNKAKLQSMQSFYNTMQSYRRDMETSNKSDDSCIRAVKLRLSKLAQQTTDEWFCAVYQAELQDILENYPDQTDKILELSNVHAREGTPTEYSLVDVARYLTKSLGSFNAIFVNSIGVAMGFLSTISLLYTPAGGIYTPAAGLWLLFALVTGASAGFACAWCLTKSSLENTADSLFSFFYDPKFYNSSLRRQITHDKQKAMEKRGEKLWSWLCLPSPTLKFLRPVMITGFSIASSLFNYVSGVKGAILINSLVKYLMNPLHTANPLVNLRQALQTAPLQSLPLYARLSGIVSAAVTLITTSALLIDVANTPRHKDDSSHKGFISTTLFALTFILSVSGQLYMQTITTFWSHGLPGLLTNLGLQTAYVSPVTYALGITVIPGMLICAKLLSDATHDTILAITPATKQTAVSSKAIGTNKQLTKQASSGNNWFKSFFPSKPHDARKLELPNKGKR